MAVTAPQGMSDEQMQVRVVWLYYMEGRTQGEIADALSTNRLRVNRIISEARRTGLVTITLNSRLASCVELEQQLIKAFGLKRAIIVPTPEDAALVPTLLGQATADYVGQLLADGTMTGIGVGWGTTLRETVRHMPSLKRPELLVNLAFAIPFTPRTSGAESPSHRLMHRLHTPVAFLILPLFALANAGIALDAQSLPQLTSDNGLGIALGLVIGKPLGVFLFATLAITAGVCALPSGVRLPHLLGAGLIGGIGFTMSIFITNLAFAGDAGLIDTSKLSVLCASLLAGILGYLWLRSTLAASADTR